MAINIQALLKQAIHEATANKDDAYFITLQHKTDKQHWLQLTGDSINMYYPFEQHPDVKLKELDLPPYPGQEISLWEAELFLTLGHDAMHTGEIVAFAEAYLATVMGYKNDGEDWDVSFE